MREDSAIWYPFAPLKGGPEKFKVVKAEGVKLHLEDGRVIIDAIASWWVNLHGHGNKVIADALYKQALNLEHVIFAGFYHDPGARVASRVSELLGPTFKKVFFSDDGSTAVEVGLKMGIQYWKNKGEKEVEVIALEGAYHGDTFGSMAMGNSGTFFEAFDDKLFPVKFIDLPLDQTSVDQFEKLMETDTAKVFVFEPLLQGAAGMRIYPAEILDKILSIAAKHKVIAVADEVLTGFGRTGKLFASHHLTNVPDIVCLSKGITGGFMPLGLTVASKRIVDDFDNDDKAKAFYHGHSYTGNPLSCAAANASLDILTSSQCTDDIARIGAKHAEAKILLQSQENIGSVKQLGTVLSIEIKTGEETSYFNSLRDWLYNSFLDKGILLRPLGNVIYVLPPYVITNDELDYIYASIIEVLKQLPE